MLCRGDFRNISVSERFGIVTMLMDTLNHAPTFEDMNSVFNNICNILIPKGFFVFDFFTLQGFITIWNKENSFQLNDILLKARSSFNKTKGRATLVLEAEHLNVPGEEIWKEKIVENFFAIKDILDGLKNNGIKVLSKIPIRFRIETGWIIYKFLIISQKPY